uniref:Class I SAM-dependent methyltransferase n=1 Tax=Angiostrongylus cantonensis TaxID=6313 RepID=A0A0K0CUA1_ANGCA
MRVLRFDVSQLVLSLLCRFEIQVDCFLYDDYALHEMMKSGKFGRYHYSIPFVELREFSHWNCKLQKLKILYGNLVPLKSQRDDFRVLDIGSRLGAVIYAACIYGYGAVTHLSLMSSAISVFRLSNIEVVCADVRSRYDVVSQADLIVMNNVFSFFWDTEQQADCFEFIHKHAKKGCFIIHNPDIETASAHLKLPFTINEWIEKHVRECLRYYKPCRDSTVTFLLQFYICFSFSYPEIIVLPLCPDLRKTYPFVFNQTKL